jgi:hypothetical protein
LDVVLMGSNISRCYDAIAEIFEAA